MAFMYLEVFLVLFFMADVVLNYITAFYDEDGVLVFNRASIAINYVLGSGCPSIGWFWIDVIDILMVSCVRLHVLIFVFQRLPLRRSHYVHVMLLHRTFLHWRGLYSLLSRSNCCEFQRFSASSAGSFMN